MTPPSPQRLGYKPRDGDTSPARAPRRGGFSIRAGILAAVHQQILAGDVAGVHAAQEGAGRAELLRRAEAAGRIELGARLVFLLVALAALGGARFVGAAQPVGVERAGQQAVDGDAVAHGDAGDAGHEAGQPAARTVAQAQDVDRRLHRARGDVHDAPEAALHHAVDRRFDELDGRQHVGVDRLDPVVAGPLAEVAGRRAAGVVDANVGLRTGGEHLLAAGVGRDVDGDSRHLDAGLLADFLSRRLELGLGARVDHEIDAFLRQRHGATLAQSLARRTDDRLAALDT